MAKVVQRCLYLLVVCIIYIWSNMHEADATTLLFDTISKKKFYRHPTGTTTKPINGKDRLKQICNIINPLKKCFG